MSIEERALAPEVCFSFDEIVDYVLDTELWERWLCKGKRKGNNAKS
jgi:hypothetical protein